MTPDDVNNQIDKRVTEKITAYTDALANHIEQSVQGAVKVTVNGKIDGIRKLMEEHSLKDDEWKKNLTDKIGPALTAFNNGEIVTRFVIGGAKVMGVIGGAVIAFYGAAEAIKQYFHS